MKPDQQHGPHWEERLLDWLDGDIAPEEARRFEAHLATCPACQQQLRQFQKLDAALKTAAPKLTLDTDFDRRLYARIDEMTEAQRAAARARVEQELRENLRALKRSWRRTLMFLVPGIIAGVALAFVISEWIFSAGVAKSLLGSTNALSAQHALLLQAAVTALLGAGIGAGVGRWIAGLSE